jgi:hypothetical protein
VIPPPLPSEATPPQRERRPRRQPSPNDLVSPF